MKSEYFSTVISNIHIENTIFSILKVTSYIKPEQPVRNFNNITHQHSNAELFFCECGHITISALGKEFHLYSGDIAIIPNSIEHSSDYSIGSSWSALHLTIKKSEIKNDNNLYQQIHPLIFGDTILVFNNLPIEQKIIAKKIMFESFDKEYLLALAVAQLLIFLQNSQISNSTNKFTLDCNDMQRLYTLDNTIHRKFTENLTLADLAKTLFLSEKQISRIIKKNYGKTLRQVLIYMRINAAEDLLKNTDFSLLQISSEIGFSSVTAFTKEFIKKHGISPKEYRNKTVL